MRHWKIWFYLVGMIAILGICIFASIPTGVIVQRAPTQVKVASQIESSAETPVSTADVAVEPTLEEKEAPTETSVETEIAAVETVDYCLTCHTDKDQLIQTASQIEEVPEESEGAG
jgi:hypothetical protein